MKKTSRPGAIILALSLILAACGSVAPTPIIEYVVVTATMPPVSTTESTATITATADPCTPENIETTVQEIHKLMREFDDASTLAASRPREQLADSIANLQRIRRAAEEQNTPACLATLKTYQVSHMNAVINTLIGFMGGAQQEAVDQGIAVAKDQHDRYTIELARVLGITMVPATAAVTPTQTPTP